MTNDACAFLPCTDDCRGEKTVTLFIKRPTRCTQRCLVRINYPLSAAGATTGTPCQACCELFGGKPVFSALHHEKRVVACQLKSAQ